MLMGCKLLFQNIFLFFICIANAQVHVDFNLDELHQDWHYSNSESDKNQITLYSNFRRAEEQGGGISSYKFSRRDSVLYLRHTKIRKFSSCGNSPNINTTTSLLSWNKGIWKLFEEEGIFYLEFRHYSTGKGKKYKLIWTERFELLQINQDKMILLKLYEK